MARSVITPGAPAINASAVLTKDAIDAVNDHEIDISNISSDKIILSLENTNTVLHTYTILAGNGSESVQGDLVITSSAIQTQNVALESARFKQADGNIYIDVVSATPLGNIYATKSHF